MSEPASTDPCALAVDRLTEECKFEVTGFEPGTELSCTGATACAADCLYSTPCADIKNNTSKFLGCVNACE